MARLHHRVDEEERDGDHHEGVEEARVAGDAREALGAAREVEAQDAVDVEHDHADDLGEAEGDDGEVVALQAQGGDADDHAADGGHDAAEEQAAGEEGRGGGAARDEVARAHAEDGLQAHDEDGAGVASHRHEAGVAQRQLAQVARGDVERDGHDDVDADLLQHRGLVAADGTAVDEQLAHDEEREHEEGVYGVAHGHGEGLLLPRPTGHSDDRLGIGNFLDHGSTPPYTFSLMV